jgi:hypothetical protein
MMLQVVAEVWENVSRAFPVTFYQLKTPQNVLFGNLTTDQISIFINTQNYCLLVCDAM